MLLPSLDNIVKDEYVEKVIIEELKKHNIPPGFILGIHENYCKSFIVGKTIPIYENRTVIKEYDREKIIGVIIKIGDCNKSKLSKLSVLFHEFYHAIEYYKGEDNESFLTEIKADLYSYKLLFYYFSLKMYEKIKKIL
ncbi:MAG: hypothetical protein ACP5GJ_01565 [Nanopusillaceae archaeon]